MELNHGNAASVYGSAFWSYIAGKLGSNSWSSWTDSLGGDERAAVTWMTKCSIGYYFRWVTMERVGKLYKALRPQRIHIDSNIPQKVVNTEMCIS